ncbi:MAG: NADH-quinone oxidoreductase subunit J, partial [Verrucomicrobia bacterium]
MRLLLFWLFSVLMLAFAFGIVTSRNTVISAMNLVVSFIFLACLFFTLDAFFIGIAQILIYA